MVHASPERSFHMLLNLSLRRQWNEIQSSPIVLRFHFSRLLQWTVIPLTLHLFPFSPPPPNFGALSHAVPSSLHVHTLCFKIYLFLQVQPQFLPENIPHLEFMFPFSVHP